MIIMVVRVVVTGCVPNDVTMGAVVVGTVRRTVCKATFVVSLGVRQNGWAVRCGVPAGYGIDLPRVTPGLTWILGGPAEIFGLDPFPVRQFVSPDRKGQAVGQRRFRYAHRNGDRRIVQDNVYGAGIRHVTTGLPSDVVVALRQ